MRDRFPEFFNQLKVKPITTIIVDDEKSACNRLESLLKSVPQLKLLGCFTSSVEAINFIIKNKPDLVFLDVELENNVSAFEIINQLKSNLYCPYLIIVTAYPHYSIKAIKNEIFDYILKPVDLDELKATVNHLIEHLSLKPMHLLKGFNMLSQRELEVLKIVLEGKSSSEVADLLYISINTVNSHRRNILKKTGAKSVIDLFRIRNYD